MAPCAEIANLALKEKGMYKEENKVREFTDEEIKKTIDDFAYATELSIKSGYDGVEIHGAIIILFNNFIHLLLIEELMIGVVLSKKE